MALLLDFQCMASLPSAEETRLGDTITQSANVAVLCGVQAKWPIKRKAHTMFIAEQRAAIGRYAFEHVNTAVVNKFA